MCHDDEHIPPIAIGSAVGRYPFCLDYITEKRQKCDACTLLWFGQLRAALFPRERETVFNLTHHCTCIHVHTHASIYVQADSW